MKLVSYLRALLSQFVSKKETAFIAQQGLPKEKITQYELQDKPEDQHFVSPCDGYAVVQSLGSAGNAQVSCNGVRMCVAGQQVIGSYFVPVIKGANVVAYMRDNTGLINFVRSVGGGNSILNPILWIQGGGLCPILSHFLTHLRAKLGCRSILNTSPTIFRREELTKTKLTFITPLHLTDMFKYVLGGVTVAHSRTLLLKQERAHFPLGNAGAVQQQTPTHEPFCLLEKAIQSLFDYPFSMVKSLTGESSSSSVSVRSLSFGGALC